ncbi:MAG TPA: patatin-like phospholipase family protein [Kofleriaceae bacterium]|nr:patatin-like phospholipase family protein [Kofleriaceae bacterium]
MSWRMSRMSDLLEPNNLRLAFAAYNGARDLARDLREDLSFVRTLVRSLGPGARAEPPAIAAPIFAGASRFAAPALAGQRIGLVASGGSGATAALCGVRRAFEDAGLEVAAISACSGAALFASLWASGLSSEEMARFWLSMRTRDYVDPDFRRLALAPLRAFRGFGGLLRGEAIERTYSRRLGPRTLGETEIPFSAVVWNIDRNRVEYLSSRSAPHMTVARAARIAISIPLMVEPVAIGEHLYGDGGIVDIFPVEPLLDQRLDHIIGLNFYLPPDFDGEDIGPWYQRSFSILRASGQLRYATYLELARAHARQLGSRLTLLHPVPFEEVRGARFYETFLDRRRWPEFMRMGYRATRAALEQLGRRADSAPRALQPN